MLLNKWEVVVRQSLFTPLYSVTSNLEHRFVDVSCGSTQLYFTHCQADRGLCNNIHMQIVNIWLQECWHQTEDNTQHTPCLKREREKEGEKTQKRRAERERA